MRKIAVYGLLILMSISLTRCPGPDKPGRQGLRRGGPAGTGVPDNLVDRNQNGSAFNSACNIPSNIALNGVVADNRSATEFRSDLEAFLGSIGDPAQGHCQSEGDLCLGEVSNRCDANTGIRFSGKIDNANPIRAGQTNSGQLSSGTLDLVIFDSNAAESNGDLLAIGIHSTLSSGSLNNNAVDLTLTWLCGTLHLTGQITQDAKFINGSMTFDNNRSGSGCSTTNRAHGTVGNISVPACNASYGLFKNCG